MDGPNGEYTLYGHHEFKGWLNGLNSVGGSKKGKCEFRLPDGTVITIDNPVMSVEGIMSSTTRHINYEKATIEDLSMGMTCEIQFNPKFDTSYKGMAFRNTVGWIPGFGGLGKNKKT